MGLGVVVTAVTPSARHVWRETWRRAGGGRREGVGCSPCREKLHGLCEGDCGCRVCSPPARDVDQLFDSSDIRDAYDDETDGE